MLTTPLTRYRIGDATGPSLDAVRPGIDIEIFAGPDATEWVKATPRGGASMRAERYVLKRPTSRWWRLRAGTPFPPTLTLRNDHGLHWMSEPSEDMPLAAYIAALQVVTALFV